MKYLILTIAAIFLFSLSCSGQDTIQIAIISEADEEDLFLQQFINDLKSEIILLTQYEHIVQFTEYFAKYDLVALQRDINSLYTNPDIDIVIASGSLSSAIIARSDDFPKPTIASIIIDREEQKIPHTDSGTSGVENFTYLQSPFSISKDLKILHEISDFKRLAVIGSIDFDSYLPFLDKLFGRVTAELGATHVNLSVGDDIIEQIENLSEPVDACYVLPLFNDIDDSELANMFRQINSRGIPTSALLGDQYAEAGALIGYQAGPNLQKMPRRLAINVLKILEGLNPKNIPVEIPTYVDHVVINMESARITGVYPDWDLMNKAILINFHKHGGDTLLNLHSIIVEVLQHNLGFLAQQKDPQIAEKDIALAKSELRPQISAGSSIAMIDPTRAETSFGTQGRTNWLASGSLSQLILAEPAVANVAIQKLLQKSTEKKLEQSYLDIILQAAEAYLNVLQSERNLAIALQNETLNRENFDIASAKERVGYAGASDLNRWRTELALASIDVNNASAGLEQSRIFLNQLLNYPQDEFLGLEKTSLEDQVVLVTDPRILSQIQNQGDLRLFADFLVDEALRNAPEIAQLDYGIAAQERLQLSQKRAFYLPSIGLSGQWDYTVQRWNVKESPGVPIPTSKPSWSLGIGLDFPIIQGQRRKHQLSQTKLGILQLKDQLGDVGNQIELRVRSNLELAGASFSRLQLFREAADAANANFQIIQDAYAQGSVNITTVIDAQNAALQTELSAQNAVFQFIIDFLTLERSTGKFYFLAPPSEKTAFFERLDQYISQQKLGN